MPQTGPRSGALARIDMKKVLKSLYHASARDVVQVEVPPLNYLMVDGEGDPNSTPAYQQAVEALYSVSYTAKFMLKQAAAGIDYAVMPLEGLWWADDLSAFVAGDRRHWKWTMMILQPDCVPRDVIVAATAAVREKKSLPALDRLRFETFTEGRCAQVMHVGPFTDEGPTIARLHAYIESRAALAGKHHEIYLSDIRRADPRKWKTIIRQPMT